MTVDVHRTQDMKTELSEKQLKDAVGAMMYLSPTQVDVFSGLLSSLQPWQAEFLNTLLDDRAADKGRIKFLETILDSYQNLGDKVQDERVSAGTLTLPGGYLVAEHNSHRGQFLVLRMANDEAKPIVQHLSSEAAAISAAYDLDRKDDPYRWRLISETCPAETMLLFACADWAHSVELGKPVPVKTGYRGEDGLRIFGASWRPTHWCYQPEGPLCSAAPEATAS
jgi:hypothetical protein